MSSFQDTQAEEKKKNTRRRKPTTGRKRPAGAKTEEGSAPAEKVERAARPKVERPPAVPFPADLIGKVSSGIVNAVVRRGKVKFGFINLGSDEKANDVPRIYFSFENITDSEFVLRRGYPVEFQAKLDDKGRPNAVDIKLGANGTAVAVEREAIVAAKKAERAATNAAAAAGAERERKPKSQRPPRKPVEDRLVTLKVTCHGHKDGKMLEVNLAHSVGKLKNVAVSAFEAPLTYNVYHVSPEGEVFMTRSILNKLTSSDTVHLGEPKEKA